MLKVLVKHGYCIRKYTIYTEQLLHCIIVINNDMVIVIYF